MDELTKQAERLHHFSMIYAGSMAEIAKGEKIFGLPHGYPGLSETRDLIDLILILRAEVNALTSAMATIYPEFGKTINDRFAKEYKFIADAKEKQFNVESNELGLTYKFEQRRNGQ